MWNKFTRGEALIDVVIGTTLIGFFVISTFNVLLGILKESGQITKRIQANWVANSYMEQITHFPFTDPDDSDSGSDMDDVDDFNDYSVVNYGLTVTVNVNDAEVNEGIISLPDLPLLNPDFKQVRVTISDGGLSEPIELKTLVPLDALPPPYITEIYTDYECPDRICGDNESSREYAEQVDNIPIKVVFDRQISVSNIEDITLTLKNVTQSVTYGTDGIEGDVWYHDNLLNELVLDDGLLEGYGDDLVSKVNEGQDPITATGSSVSLDNLELTFIYERGEPDAKYHTSTTFDDYLDVEKINLNGETIEGLVNGEPDGVQALDEDEDGFLDQPTDPESMLTSDEVILLNSPATFYIFYEQSGDDVDGWEALQKVVNPEQVEEMVIPSLGDVFDLWTRFNGNIIFEPGDELDGNASSWQPRYVIPGGDRNDTRNEMTEVYSELDHFKMDLNVEPPNGFISPNLEDELILEVTLNSDYNYDNDMIGLVIAYAKGSNQCNQSSLSHDIELCTSVGNKPYVLIAGRSTKGSIPKQGWGLIYGEPGVPGEDAGPSGAYPLGRNYNWYSEGHAAWTTEAPTYTGTSEYWIIEETSPSGTRTASQNWNNYNVRIRIERDGNNVTARTSDWFSSRPDPEDVIYREGSDILTVDLASDRRLHKFIGGSQYGYITFSQPKARYFDPVMPQPVVERNVDYVIYFHNRQDTDYDGIYDTWAPFDLTVDNATGDNGRTLCYGLPTCSHPPPHEHNAKDLRRSGIWKWDETVDPARWVFRENALNELLGRTVQEAAGHYRIISPDEEMFGDDHMFTEMIGSPASGDVSDNYLIRSRSEVSDDY